MRNLFNTIAKNIMNYIKNKVTNIYEIHARTLVIKRANTIQINSIEVIIKFDKATVTLDRCKFDIIKIDGTGWLGEIDSIFVESDQTEIINIVLYNSFVYYISGNNLSNITLSMVDSHLINLNIACLHLGKITRTKLSYVNVCYLIMDNRFRCDSYSSISELRILSIDVERVKWLKGIDRIFYIEKDKKHAYTKDIRNYMKIDYLNYLSTKHNQDVLIGANKIIKNMKIDESNIQQLSCIIPYILTHTL